MLTKFNLPKSSVPYVFGSFLSSSSPRDIDILIVYDPAICNPAQAYDLHLEFADNLERAVGLPVHLTLLAMEEERGCGFIADARAVPLETVDRIRLIR